MNYYPIGVFDSGMGGLTVLRELMKQLPRESFLYLGDTARLPYGTKSAETIKQYSRQMTEILMSRQIKLLVVACNSATSASIPYLRQLFPDLPIVAVVEPGVAAALRETKNNKIAVFATEATVASHIYQSTIQHFQSDAMVVSKGCGLLVALAEEGLVSGEIASAVVKKYIHEIEAAGVDYDVVILGCTHFPVFIELFENILGSTISIVNSAKETAMAVDHVLEKLGIRNAQARQSVHFLVTDLPDRFIRVGSLFLGAPIDAGSVSLVDVRKDVLREVIE